MRNTPTNLNYKTNIVNGGEVAYLRLYGNETVKPSKWDYGLASGGTMDHLKNIPENRSPNNNTLRLKKLNDKFESYNQDYMEKDREMKLRQFVSNQQRSNQWRTDLRTHSNYMRKSMSLNNLAENITSRLSTENIHNLNQYTIKDLQDGTMSKRWLKTRDPVNLDYYNMYTTPRNKSSSQLFNKLNSEMTISHAYKLQDPNPPRYDFPGPIQSPKISNRFFEQLQDKRSEKERSPKRNSKHDFKKGVFFSMMNNVLENTEVSRWSKNYEKEKERERKEKERIQRYNEMRQQEIADDN